MQTESQFVVKVGQERNFSEKKIQNMLELVVEKCSSPICEHPPDEAIGSFRSNDNEDSLSKDGSPTSLFKSRIRQKQSGFDK